MKIRIRIKEEKNYKKKKRRRIRRIKRSRKRGEEEEVEDDEEEKIKKKYNCLFSMNIINFFFLYPSKSEITKFINQSLLLSCYKCYQEFKAKLDNGKYEDGTVRV